MTSFSSSERVVIVGASSDIGCSLARLLNKAGVTVGLISRPSGRFERIRSETGFVGVEIETASDTEISSAIKVLSNQIGPITGAVNMLGTLLLKPAHLTTFEEWQNTISVNLDSSFSLIKAVIANTNSSKLSVVLMSSAAAFTGIPNHEAIAAAKAGVEGLARSAAATYASRGYRFNVVAPGLTHTTLTAGLTGNEASLRASEAMHPLGRLGTPDEIAKAVAWLISDESAWITGQVLGVDGGLARVRPRLKG